MNIHKSMKFLSTKFSTFNNKFSTVSTGYNLLNSGSTKIKHIFNSEKCGKLSVVIRVYRWFQHFNRPYYYCCLKYIANGIKFSH